MVHALNRYPDLLHVRDEVSLEEGEDEYVFHPTLIHRALINCFDATTQDGWTALMLSCRDGAMGITLMLLDRGADANAQNKVSAAPSPPPSSSPPRSPTLPDPRPTGRVDRTHGGRSSRTY